MAPQSPRNKRFPPPPAHRRTKSVRLLCEQLEDRVTPALFNVQSPLSFTGLNNNGFVGVTDLNKDGFDDAILTNFGTDYSTGAGTTITALYGKAGGGFNRINLSTGGQNVSFASIADINGDTWPDVVVSNANRQNPGSVSVFKNDGAGNLSLFGTPFSSFSNNPSWIGLSDITGDNVLDVVVGSFGKIQADEVVGQCVTIFEGHADAQGKGDFTYSASPITTLAPEIQFIPTALAVADFDRDGILDIAAAVPGVPLDEGEPQPEGNVYVFRGTGGGGFEPYNLFGTGGALPVNIQAADINGDNRLDLIVANAGDPNANPEFKDDAVGVLPNVSSPGSVTFGITNSITANTYGTFAVAVADFDLNGKMDIAAVNYGAQLFGTAAFVSIYMGNGTGTFTPGSPGTYDTQTGLGGGQYLAVGDFDDNNSPDLIVAHATNRVGLLLNTTVAGPSVTINQGASQPDPTHATSIVFDVVFSEGVTGFTGSDIDFTGSSVGGLSASVVAIDTSRYTVTVTGMVGTGVVKVSIPAGAATSIANSADSLASTSTDNQVNFDLVAPTVTINQASGQADPTSTGPILFTVVFSENVTGFGAADVDLSSSSLGGLSAAVTQNTPSNYTVSVTGMSGNGTVVAKVVAGAALDAAGNASAASTSTDNTVTFSTSGSAPTVTINQGASQLDPTNATSILFDVVFSEGVTGFTGTDIDFTGSSVGGLSASVTPIDTSRYTVSVTGMVGTGLVKVSIPAGAATSISGSIASMASTSTDNQVSFDLVAPTVTINQANGQADPATSGPILFTVVFSENVTGFGSADIDLSGSSLSGLSATVTPNSPSNYTVSVTGMSGTGTVVAKVVAGAALDVVGNASAGSTSGDNTVTFDGVSPSVTINQAVGQPDPTTVASIVFSVKFSEPVTGFSSADVSFAGSTVGGSLSANVTGSLDTYTVTVTGMTSAGLVIATIPAGGATDAAGNANLASTSTDNSVQFLLESNPGSIGFTQSVYNTTEDPAVHTVTMTVTRTGGTDGAVSIQYGTSDGTAHSLGLATTGQDDYAPTSGVLSWDDGEGGDKTFTIEIRPDALNEGKELIGLALTNPTGSPGLGLTTASAAIAPSDGQGPGVYFDQDGDTVKIKLKGLTGALQFFRTDPDGDGRGPIELVNLTNTLPNPLAPVAALVIKVGMSPTSTDGGTVGLGAVTGSGLKKIAAPQANLNLEGVNLSGYLKKLMIGNIVNGADITTLATSNPLQATKISALRILDGTVIDIGARLSNLTATSFGAGLIKAPSVGTITINGAMAADVHISGVGVSQSEQALTALIVNGTVTGSDIMVTGNVGTVAVLAFRDSRLFAGYTGGDDGTGTFNRPATVSMFKSTGTANGFQNSRVIAARFQAVTITNLDSTNPANFGFYADTSVAALKVVGPTPFTYDPTFSGWQGVDDFEVLVV